MCTTLKISFAIPFLILTTGFSKFGAAERPFPRDPFHFAQLPDEGEIEFPYNFRRSLKYERSERVDSYQNFQRNFHRNPIDRYESPIKKVDELLRENIHQHVDDNSTIPLDLFWEMNNFTDVNDLLLNFVDDFRDDIDLTSRFDDGGRSAAIVPKAAACMPELQTVKIAIEEDPSIIYIPSCTRVERCGGCCSHHLFSCQPTDVETVSFQVVKTQFMGGSKLKFMGKEIKLVERHTKCKCDCKIKEENCTKFQQYRKSECRCVCINTDEEKKCYKENATKLWDPDICACQCRNIMQCSTGYTFDMITCKCVPVLIRRRHAQLDEEGGFENE